MTEIVKEMCARAWGKDTIPEPSFKKNAFKKNDAGKPRWSLLPWDVLLGVVHILGFGADKYGAENWANGAEWSRYYNSTMRHLIAFWMGERCDPESGRSHLLHAICGLLFLAAYEIRGIGRDDRPQVSPEPEATAEEAAQPSDDQVLQALDNVLLSYRMGAQGAE